MGHFSFFSMEAEFLVYHVSGNQSDGSIGLSCGQSGKVNNERNVSETFESQRANQIPPLKPERGRAMAWVELRQQQEVAASLCNKVKDPFSRG